MMNIKRNTCYYYFQFLILFFSSHCLALDLNIDNPNYIPPEFGGIVRVGCGNSHNETEYESNLGMIDEQLYKSNDCQIFSAIVPWKRLMVGFDFHYDIDQEYELKFGSQSSRSGDASYSSSASGFLDPDLILAYEVISQKRQWNQQIFFKINPLNIDAEPRKIFRGGHDIAIEYRFSYLYESDSLYGSLYSHYFGRKDYFQPGDNRMSKKQAYTEVGLTLGYIYRFSKKWSFKIGGNFALSSDYDVVTPEVVKTADKGFLIAGKVGINYYISSRWMISSVYEKWSRVYNATNENRNQDIDYETEEVSLLFSLTHIWDFRELARKVKSL